MSRVLQRGISKLFHNLHRQLTTSDISSISVQLLRPRHQLQKNDRCQRYAIGVVVLVVVVLVVVLVVSFIVQSSVDFVLFTMVVFFVACTRLYYRYVCRSV